MLITSVYCVIEFFYLKEYTSKNYVVYIINILSVSMMYESFEIITFDFAINYK